MLGKLKLNKHYNLGLKDLIMHCKNYRNFLIENGLPETSRAVLAEMYFWLNLAMHNYQTNEFVVNGFRFQTIPNDFGISAELKVFGNHEPLAASLLPKILKEGMTCIDIGANLGFYALIEGKIIGEKGTLIVLEPSPLTARYLESNLKNNGIKFQLQNIALLDRDDKCYFIIDERSNLSRISSKPDSCNGQTVVVKTMRLDTLVANLQLSGVDFLRMDVEGAEVLISKGWERTIKKFKPILFIEFHKIIGLKSAINMLSFLVGSGYTDAFYIKRSLNNCLIGNPKDIKKIKISELLAGLKSGVVPFRDFHLITLKAESQR